MSNNIKASYIAAVTPADGTDLPGGLSGGIYVGVTGDLAIMDQGGTSVTLPNILAGVFHPINAKRILATGTTAASIRVSY